MNNAKGDQQTMCMIPKDPQLFVTKKYWENIKKGNFYIINKATERGHNKDIIEDGSIKVPSNKISDTKSCLSLIGKTPICWCLSLNSQIKGIKYGNSRRLRQQTWWWQDPCDS